jgi:tetratricopeptide (TPR) repeat protein
MVLFTAAACCAATAWAAGVEAPASPAPPPPAAAPTFPPGLLEAAPEPLVPKHPPTETDGQRLEAMRLFAAGRAHEQRQEYARALQLYERALQYDPGVNSIAQAVVWLAFHQKQYDVAVRYLKMCDPADDDPKLLDVLSDYLVEQEDFAGAAALLERAVAALETAKDDAGSVMLQVELGRIYHLLGQYKKAADNFARVVPALDHPERFDFNKAQKAILDKARASYDLIGESFLLADRPQEATAAFEEYEKYNAKAANPGLLQYNLARVSARSGKAAEALSRLEESFALQKAPLGTGPYELLAQVLKQLGKEKELLPRLEKLHAAAENNVLLAYYLAGQYRRAEQLDKAEALYSALLKKAPTNQCYQELAELYRTSKRTDALLGLLGAALADDGHLDVLGIEEEKIAGDAALLRALAAAARQRLHKGPEKLDYGACRAVALLALEGKQYDTAGEFFELAIARRPKQAGELLLRWGLGLLDQRPAEAAKLFQRGVDQTLSPSDKLLLFFYLARALAMCDRTDEALAAAGKAVEMNKSSPLVGSGVAWILHHAKRYDEAIAANMKFIARFDADYDSPDVRDYLREARLNLSALCVLKKRMPEAEEWLQQVLDEYPEDAGACNDLGYLWADQGKHLARALAMIRQAVAAEPENIAYRDSLGWVLYRLGRYPEAVAELQKAAAGKDPDAAVLDHLGDAQQQAGQAEQARQSWRLAAAAFRKDKDEEQAKRVEAKINRRR